MEAELEGKREIEEGENENLSYSDTMILQLVQKNAKLKKKLLAERKLGEIKLFFYFVLGFYCHTLCFISVEVKL